MSFSTQLSYLKLQPCFIPLSSLLTFNISSSHSCITYMLHDINEVLLIAIYSTSRIVHGRQQMFNKYFKVYG